METNKIVPIVGVVVVVAAILILYFAFSPSPAASPVTTATSTLPIATSSAVTTPSTPAAVAPAQPASPAVNPGGSIVSGQTVWRAMTPGGWGLTFSADTKWQVSINKDTNGNSSYVSLGGPTSAIVVSKDLHIATPTDITPSITTQEIAGRPISVSKYDNPQKGYAYSLSFMIPVKGSTYYVLYQSATTSMKTSNDFLSLIQATK